MQDATKRLGFSQPAAGTGRDAALHAGPEDILPVSARLLAQGWFLEDISALDVQEGLALLYHFAHWTLPGRIAVRVMLPHQEPACPSIESVFPGAAWHEREARDFFGIVFEGASNDSPLLLHEHLDPPPLLKTARGRVPSHILWPHSEKMGTNETHARIRSVLGDAAPPGETP